MKKEIIQAVVLAVVLSSVTAYFTIYKSYLNLEKRVDAIESTWQDIVPVTVNTSGQVMVNGKCFKPAIMRRCHNIGRGDHYTTIDTPCSQGEETVFQKEILIECSL